MYRILRWLFAKIGYDLVPMASKMTEADYIKEAVTNTLTSCPLYCVDGSQGIGYRVMYVGFSEQEIKNNENVFMKIGLDGNDVIGIANGGRWLEDDEDGTTWPT